MSLITTLNAEIKTAMKAKDKMTLSVLRMVKAALQNEAIKVNRDLTKEDELTVLSREMKQRKDALKEFQAAHRDDLVQQLEQEITVLTVYMPKQLSKEEITEIVKKAIEETGTITSSDFGKVMGKVMPQVKGKADGKVVNATVKELLA